MSGAGARAIATLGGVRGLAVVGSALALASPAAGAATGSGYSFGRQGGNIIPFTVTVSARGRVHATGPVKVGRTHLSAAQLAAVAGAARSAGFASLPTQTLCPGTLPDVAATFVAVGSKRVMVHGNCVPRYAKVWNALSAAVKLIY